MISSADKYRFTDVSNIEIHGDILPARDARGDDSACVLCAEDVAYLCEMYKERFGLDGSFSSIYDNKAHIVSFKPQLVLDGEILLRIDNELRAMNYSGYDFIKKDYVFSPMYDIAYISYLLYVSRYIIDMYGDSAYFQHIKRNPDAAFGENEPDNDRTWLSLDRMRARFYDLQNITRVWLYCDRDTAWDGFTSSTRHETDHTGLDKYTYHVGLLYGWSHKYEKNTTGGIDTFYDSVVYGASFANAVVPVSTIYDGGRDHIWKDAQEVIVFVGIYTTASGDAGNVDKFDIIPVNLVKSNDDWVFPQSPTAEDMLKAAISRYGLLTTPPAGGSDYDGSVQSSLDTCNIAVVRIGGRTDLSELGWQWKPDRLY